MCACLLHLFDSYAVHDIHVYCIGPHVTDFWHVERRQLTRDIVTCRETSARGYGNLGRGGIQARPDWPPWIRHSVKQMARPKLLSYAHNKTTKTKAWFNRLHHPARGNRLRYVILIKRQ